MSAQPLSAQQPARALPPEPDTETEPDIEVVPSAVTVDRLEKLFDARPVLRSVSCSLPAGATMALLGPNGAGKTTLLRVLATLAKPTSGAALVAGFDVVRDAGQVRRLVGYVGHQPHVYEELTAHENLLFFARMYGLRDGPARASQLLQRVGLGRRADERVRTLSRGQTQRLAIARGLLHDPSVLLLDEPDTGLDDEAATLLKSLLEERSAAGGTTIFTTHDLERGLQWSEQTLVLVGGRAVYCGESRALEVGDVRHMCDQTARVRR